VRVAGIDGAPGGWAIVTMDEGDFAIQRIATLFEFFDDHADLDIAAIDMPIGLLDSYEVGGRPCDRAARATLGKRASSVFPAPVRQTLEAISWDDACIRSRASAPSGKAISRQTFGILPKIKEADELLQKCLKLRDIIREVHPEVCFAVLTGASMVGHKSSKSGREERQQALKAFVPSLSEIESSGRAQRLPIEDVLDATVACWTASRIANGHSCCLPSSPTIDSTGLPMAIWA
jgi:predicted RNase H-like nuclease